MSQKEAIEAMQVQTPKDATENALHLKDYRKSSPLLGMPDYTRPFFIDSSNPIFFPSISQAKRRLINRRLNKFPKRK